MPGADRLAGREIRVDDVAEDLARTRVKRRQRARFGGTFCGSRHDARMAGTGRTSKARRFPAPQIEKNGANCQTSRQVAIRKRGAALGETLRSGGQILVDQLVAQGVKRVYCVPGKSYLAALDALNNAPIEVTVCRQEAGAAMMALTEGRLTGRPGICFVTRGPGAMNAAHGVHIAEHDSAPMILFIGQVERAMIGRGAFQEMDYRAMFASTAKMGDPDRSRRAKFPKSCSARFTSPCKAGPVLWSSRSPRICSLEMADVADAQRAEQVPIWPGLTQMAELQKMLWAAKRPIAILGGGGWTKRASSALPICRTVGPAGRGLVSARERLRQRARQFRRRNRPSMNPKLKARVEAADLVLLVGGRMSEAARRPTRCSAFRRRGSGSFMCMPTRWRSAATIIQPLGSSRRRRSSARRWKGSSRRFDDSLDGGDARSSRGISGLDRTGAAPVRAGCR